MTDFILELVVAAVVIALATTYRTEIYQFIGYLTGGL